MVFTSKSLETMIQEGGTGNWAGKEDRLRHTKWVVATRNLKSDWTQGDEPHGSAFIIGRVSGVKASPAPEEERFVIQFDQYANISVLNAWTNNRNPIAYTSLHELGIAPEELSWTPFPPRPAVTTTPNSRGEQPATVIDQARSMIASALSISPEAVKITVAF